MKRTVLVSILAVAALSLLIAFALQSRSIPVEIHIAQHTVATEVQRVQEDFSTLVASLETAWRDGQAPGDAAAALRDRLATSPGRLSDSVVEMSDGDGGSGRIGNIFGRYQDSVAAADSLTLELLDEQGAYASAIVHLRDVGPQVIQQMRDIALDRVAADTFQLIVGTLDYAGTSSTVQEYDLRRLLTMLNRDQRLDSNLPTQVDRLLGAVTTVLDTKLDIRSKLTQLGSTPVTESAANLGAAVSDTYQTAVAGADSARTMLAVYAVTLLLAVGFIGFRLQVSYGQINRANDELAGLNESLEQRVQSRTEELTSAMSNLKESQVQLVQAEKMSSLGQLVAGISHEINTPLLYLANNATLMKERIQMLTDYVKQSVVALTINPESYRDRKEYQAEFVSALKQLKLMLRDNELESVLEEANDLMQDSIEGLEDLTDMAQSLKDFSRLDRAPVGSFDVNAGIDKTLTIARNIVKHKAEVHRFYGELPEIQCSPSKINQIFLNLITNAAQAIEDTGEIVITTKMYDDDHVAIAISDTGCGISEDNLAKIRDPFFTTKDVGTGTGLGLSIVDEIIRSHGGDLLVESEEGKGSTFTVVLPLKQPTVIDEADAEGEGNDSAVSSSADADLAQAV